MIIDRAIKLEPGCTYVIETAQSLSEKIKGRMYHNLKLKVPKSEFIILDGGLKIAKEQRKEDGCKEERVRELDINERIASDWTVGTKRRESDYEKRGLFNPEHCVQHDQAWENYIRNEREAEVHRETKSQASREGSFLIRDIDNDNGVFNGRDNFRHF